MSPPGLWVPSGDDLETLLEITKPAASAAAPQWPEPSNCPERDMCPELVEGSVHRQLASDRCRFLLPAPPVQQVLHTHRDQRDGHDQDQHRRRCCS